MPTPRRTLAARLRYRFDSALSRGPSAVVLWLLTLTAGLVVLAGLVVAALGLGISDGKSASFPESVWQAMLRILDTGTMAGDRGWALRFISVAVTLVGIFIASSLIGLIATALDQKIIELRKGRSAVLEEGHTLLLGWSPRLFTVLSELVAANENQRRAAVVILAAADKTEMEDAIRARVPSLGNTHVVCRTGDPADLEDLTMVNVAGARAIVAFAGERDGDAQVVKSVLAVRSHTTHPAAHVVAELRDAHVARNLRMAAGERVLTVQADEIIARVTAQACRHSGLSAVYRDLLDFGGDEIYFAEAPQLAGHSFGEGLLAFDEATLLGIASAGGNLQLLPSMDTLIAADDRVIALAEDDDRVVFTGFRDLQGVAHRSGDGPESPYHILVVGWSSLGPRVLTELDPFLPTGSRIDVVVDSALVQRDAGVQLRDLANSTVTFHDTEDEMDRVPALLSEDRYDEVIVLGYRLSLSPAESDARTLLTLLNVNRLLDGVSTPRPRVIAEVLDARDVAIAEATGADDFVVSDELSSLMLAQLAERPELSAVFDDLFDAKGAAIGVRPVSAYGVSTSASWAETVAVVRAAGDVAMGYRRGNGEVVLNPKKSETPALDAGSAIVVLGTFE